MPSIQAADRFWWPQCQHVHAENILGEQVPQYEMVGGELFVK